MSAWRFMVVADEDGGRFAAAVIPKGCTGRLEVSPARVDSGVAYAMHVSLQHDGATCPVHEQPYAALMASLDQL